MELNSPKWSGVIKVKLNCCMISKNIKRDQIITFLSTEKENLESPSFHGNGVLFMSLVFSTEEGRDLPQHRAQGKPSISTAH